MCPEGIVEIHTARGEVGLRAPPNIGRSLGVRSRIPQRAKAPQQAMADDGWPFWGRGFPGFTDFWAFLEGLYAGGAALSTPTSATRREASFPPGV